MISRVAWIDGKPGRVVECATIDATGVWKPLEDDIQLRRALQAGVDVKALATALGEVRVD